MLPSRGLGHLRPPAGLMRSVFHGRSAQLTRQLPTTGGARQFGTNLRGNVRVSGGILSDVSISRRRVAAPAFLSAAALLQPSSSIGRARFASTQSTPTPGAPAAVESSYASPTDVPSTPLDIDAESLFNVPERIGYLKELGLDYGWGPTSVIQWLLEHVHIYTGLPWWASISITALILRAAIFKPTLTAAQVAHRFNELRKNPKFAAAQQRMQEAAFVSKDQTTMLAARQEIRQMQRAEGIQVWRTFVPLINLPIALGMLRLMRGMAALPAPGMENGGALWFTDLTVPDPYFILPIAACVVMYRIMMIGIPHMPQANQKTFKIMALVLGPLSLVATIYFPAGLQWFFLMTGVLQLGQTWLFYRPWFRRVVGLAPLTSPSATAAIPVSTSSSSFAQSSMSWQAPRTMSTTARPAETQPSTSFLSTVKDSIGAGKDTFKRMSDSSNNRTEAARAQSHEEKRTLEEREKMLRRMQTKGPRTEKSRR